MQSNSELKPCPICGSDRIDLSIYVDAIICRECGTMGPECEDYAEKWNARPLTAEIEAAAVERFVKERFWNSACEVSACVAESGMQWAANRRKEAQG